MTYTKQTWTNGSSSTPLNATRLSHMEDGIEAGVNRFPASPYFLKETEKYYLNRTDLVGISDAAPVINTAIAAAQADGVSRLVLPPGIINVASQITIPTSRGLILEGTGEDTVLTQTVTSYTKAMITSAGTDGTKTALASDLASGSFVLTLPSTTASALAVGDTVGFESNLIVFGIGGTGDSQEGRASEYHKVEAVSGTTVTLDGPLIFNYTVADSATSYKVNLAPRMGIHNLRFTSNDPAVNKWRQIWLEKTGNISLENLTLDNAGGGIYLLDCYGGHVENVHVNRLQNFSDFRGYGLAIMGRSAELFVNNLYGRYVRHLFTTLADQRGADQYGGPRNITIQNGVGFANTSSFAVWDTHPYGYDIVFDNCHAFGGSGGNAHGFQIRSLKTKILNPVVRNMGACGITVLSVADDCDIVGGEVGFSNLQGIKVAAPNVRISGVRVYNNTAAGISYIGANELHVVNNWITDNQYGIQDTNANDASTGVIIKENIVPKSVTQTIGLLSIKKPAIVTRNILRGYGAGLDGSFTPQSGLFKVNNTIDSTVDLVDASFDFLSTFGTNPAATASIAATWAASAVNAAYGASFKPVRDMSIVFVQWVTGSVSSGNYDIGIYDNAGTKIWSKGSTAWPTASTTVSEAVTVSLSAGQTYWLAFASDNTSATIRGISTGTLGLLQLTNGTYWARQATSSFPLPSTITWANPSSGKVPLAIFREV